jgi:type II secretory pathway component PulK
MKQHGMTRRRGVILLAVLIVVTILALVSYSFFFLMTAEQEAVAATQRQAQLHLFAESGVDHAAFVLSNPQAAGLSDGDGSLLISPMAVFDNATAFSQIPVTTGNPRLQGYFSIVVPRDSDSQQSGTQSNTQGYRFGVEDESGKINVNALIQIDSTGTKASAILQKLPNMTQDIANSILNWARPAGSSSSNSDSASSDSSYYASLGYTIKNGPYESEEELLLIRGMTPRLLLGNDLNRNGFLEPQEDDGGGVRDPGLARYLTVYSRELNLNAQGQPRINVNDTDLEGLYNNLNTAVGSDLANFILAYRIYGPASGPAGGPTGGIASLTRSGLNMRPGSGSRAQKINSLFDLVGASVAIRQQGARQPTVYRSPLQANDLQTLRDKLAVLLDTVSTSANLELPARININTAPQAVLAALPGLTDANVQQILQHQPGSSTDASQAALYRTPVWLITEANLSASLVKSIEPYITARSQVFRVQVVGYYEVGGPNVRLEAVIDTNRQHPRILYWRDITELGGAFGPSSANTMSR